MSRTLQRSPAARGNARPAPRRVVGETVPSTPFTLEQELEPFARWTGAAIWVPPKRAGTKFARTMLAAGFWPGSRERRWAAVVAAHRADFAQVREIELHKASIRLPKGRLLVTVTEQDRFDTITDDVPACVQTRLEEFLAGPGRREGVKVYYLKPLCIEDGTRLVFTSRDAVRAAVTSIQEQVFTEYRRLFVADLPRRLFDGAVDALLAVPRALVRWYVARQKRALDAYHAKLEFERRKIALKAATMHRDSFRSCCTFDEMLSLTSTLDQADVVRQYAVENELSARERDRLAQLAAGTLPWFVTFSLATAFVLELTASVIAATTTTSAVAVCDPVFVAELPEAPGVLLKIGHFDEIDGVTHVEI